MPKKQQPEVVPQDLDFILNTLIETDAANAKPVSQKRSEVIPPDEDKKGLILSSAESKSFDFKRLYSLAEVGCTITEAANSMGVSIAEINKKIQEQFQITWKEYSETATKALTSEIKAKLVNMIRGGNNHLLTLYAKRFLGWSGGAVAVEGMGSDVSRLSDEELDLKIKELKDLIEKSSEEIIFPETVTVLELEVI